jgi:Predicted nucleic acid-binding protein, contains PIN domain
MAARELFLDAAYLIALAVPADAHHAKALQLLQQTESSTRLFITTQAVLFEVGDALSKPKYRAAAFNLLCALEADDKVLIVPTDAGTFASALELFHHRPDKEWSLTDCISFVVMGDNQITEALTTDEHFEQAGFVALMRH